MRKKILAYVPAALMLAGIALELRSTAQVAVPLEGPIKSILAEYMDHQVVDQTITPEERRIAGMTDFVAREYRRGDGQLAFTTLVSYYDRQTTGRSIHSPRNCLPGAGWEIVKGDTRTIEVDGVPRTVNRYVLRHKTATAIAYYWYQGRGRVTANEYVVKWNLLRDAAFVGRTEEALVRVVVPVDSASRPRAERDPHLPADVTAQTVATRLMSAVGTVLPKSGD